MIVVARQLGHANPNITATIYAHLLGDSQLDDAAAVFLERSLGQPWRVDFRLPADRRSQLGIAGTLRGTLRERDSILESRFCTAIQLHATPVL